MSERRPRTRFASRPADPEHWIRTDEPQAPRAPASSFSARLTIDVTSELRGRIKIAAFARGITVAEMLRELLDRKFPASTGDPS